VGTFDVDILSIIAPLFGVICAAICFDIAYRLGFELRPRIGFIVNWKAVFIVGATASLINSIGANFLFQNPIEIVIAYWIGDTVGLLVAMLIMLLIMNFIYPTTK